MKVIKKGEGYPRSVRVNEQLVTFEHLTLHKPSGVHYALRTTFDFTAIPADVIKRLAGETLLIRWRTAFKNAEKVDDRADNQIVSVKTMLTGRKPRMSAPEKIAALAGKLTREQLAAQIAALQATLEEKDEEAEDETFEEEPEEEVEGEEEE